MTKGQILTASAILFGFSIFAPGAVLAQQPQIPTLQVCNDTRVEGGGAVFLASRQGPPSGTFTIQIKLNCNPNGLGYPGGALSMEIDLTDSDIVYLEAINFEQVTTTGKDTPTAYMNGRCKAFDVKGLSVPGCRFWLMVADNLNPNSENPETPDIVGFLVFDGTGTRRSYGTGPLVKGDIFVAPSPF